MEAVAIMITLRLKFLRIWCLVLLINYVGGSDLDDAIAIFSQNLATKESEIGSPVLPVEVPELTEDDAEQILDLLGFNSTGHDHDAKSKIMQYQKHYGLPESGELCEATKISLKTPRCGVSDVSAHGEDYKWTKSLLSYYIRNYPEMIEPSSVERLLRNAFNQWSKVTNLDFSESEYPNADIEIVFGGRNHLNRWQSCGVELSDGTLAHAFFPEIGAIHFNSKFYFSSQSEDDFFNTAMHEIGHALGLDHSVNPASIMYPILVARYSEIPEIDAEKIQFKYGRRDRAPSAPKPTFCSLHRYDAVFHDQSRELYIVAGKYYYSNESVEVPILTSEKWPGSPDHLDAALSIGSHTYFFRGDEVWAFENNKLELGYPRKIRKTFPGLPKNLDAVVHYRNKYVFAFKSEHFWRYNTEKKMVDHSGEVEEFGIPSRIDAATYDEQQNAIVFYKNNLRYFFNCDTHETVMDDSRLYGC